MEQVGVVVEAIGDKARVKTRRHTTCSNCGKCDGGLQGLESPRDLDVVVQNPIGAREGEVVQVETADRGVLLAAFLVYIFPLVNLFLGFGLGQWLAAKRWDLAAETVGIFLGCFFLVATFLVLRSQEGRFARSKYFTAVITKVLEP